MKRMHYVAGAVGLVPAVLGMAVTPAIAGTSPATQASQAKTVSLHHVLPATARANAAAASSSSSALASPGITTGCKGNTWFHIPQNHDLKGHGWYANSTFDSFTCIGTVDVWVHFNKTFCKDVSLSVYTTGFNSWYRKHSVCGTAGTSTMTQFNVHEEFQHVQHIQGVHVCAKSTYNQAGTCTKVGS